MLRSGVGFSVHLSCEGGVVMEDREVKRGEACSVCGWPSVAGHHPECDVADLQEQVDSLLAATKEAFISVQKTEVLGMDVFAVYASAENISALPSDSKVNLIRVLCDAALKIGKVHSIDCSKIFKEYSKL